MKVLFINDSTSNPNWGDRAAAISLKKMISDSGGNIFATISEDELRHSTFHKTSIGGQHGTQQSVIKEKLKLFIPPLVLKVRQKIMEYKNTSTNDGIIPIEWDEFDNHLKILLTNHLYSDLLKKIELAELIVIHGDGCMKGNGRIPRAELFLSYVAKKHFQKPVIIVNHTADFDHPNLHIIAQEVYPLLNDVVFRETISVERCKSLCNGRYAADSAFLFEPAPFQQWLPVAMRPTYFDVWPDSANLNLAKPYICIGGSSIFSYDSVPYDLINGFSALICYLRSIYPGQIVLTVSDIIDQAVFRPVAKQLNLPLIGLTTPVQQVVDILGNAQAYIGGRWHPSIFALRGGTPVIPLSSKTFMMQALAQMTGLSSTTFDALDVDREKIQIGKTLQTYLEQGDELRRKLASWAARESEKSWDNVSYMRKLS